MNPKYKTHYCVRNWPDYERGLRARGDVTIWFSDEAVAAWTPPPVTSFSVGGKAGVGWLQPAVKLQSSCSSEGHSSVTMFLPAAVCISTVRVLMARAKSLRAASGVRSSR